MQNETKLPQDDLGPCHNCEAGRIYGKCENGCAPYPAPTVQAQPQEPLSIGNCAAQTVRAAVSSTLFVARGAKVISTVYEPVPTVQAFGQTCADCDEPFPYGLQAVAVEPGKFVCRKCWGKRNG